MAPPTFPIYDALLHGQLEAHLRRWRAEGRSTRDIADLIGDMLPKDLKISHTLVARWCADLKIEKAAVA